jgi:Trypsin
VWISFSESPDFSILPPSSSYGRDQNAQRYHDWSTALDASPDWHQATAFPHTQFDPDAFFLHDAGVLTLQEPAPMSQYGVLPTLGLLDELARVKGQTYMPVGYGLEKSGPFTSEGGDTRRKAVQKLVNLNGVFGVGDGIAAKFSSNNGTKHTGGTCFGDSGGPIFQDRGPVIVAVNSFGISSTCKGSTGGYRVDQVDDLTWLAEFSITP